MSSSYKTNVKHLPQRLPVRLRWKENTVVRAVFVRGDCGYLYLQRKEDEEPKNIWHVWNSYVKHHVPNTTSNYTPVSPRRISELELLDLLLYEDPGRLDGQTEPSLKTILTTYAPECIKLLRTAPHEPEPSVPAERIEQERKQLLHLTAEPMMIEVGHRGMGSLKATLMPDGTFVYQSRKGLNSFQLLHLYRMECDPLFYKVESLLNWTSSLDLVYVEGGAWDDSLSKRVKAPAPAKVEAPAPAPIPVKVEAPAPAKQEPEIPRPAISEDEREREAIQMAAVWKSHIREGYDAPICIVSGCPGLCYLNKNGTFSYIKGSQFSTKLHSLELLWHLNPAKVQGHTTAVQFFFFDMEKTQCLLSATEPPLSAVLKTLWDRESALKARLEGLQIIEKGRLLAMEEARKRIAALEAAVSRLEKALA